MADRLSIVTWNINSVRLRQDTVTRMAAEYGPDVICLQETKCPDADFPLSTFHEAGYPHIEIYGQKSYNGVAIISRFPLRAAKRQIYCQKEDARYLSAEIAFGQRSLRLHNYYVPAGGDIPDPEENPKFAHKLGFLEEMGTFLRGLGHGHLIVGDLNVAPYEQDVWSHRQLLNVVSHTPIECEKLEQARMGGGFVDIARKFVPMEQKLYSWWSYRARDWALSNRGRRLDHIWASADLAENIGRFDIFRDCRGWPSPSDHVPVMIELMAG